MRLLKKIKLRIRPNPCVTDEIRFLIRTNDYWRKIARKSNDRLDWAAYKNFKWEVKRKLRLAEREHVENQIRNNPNNPRCVWKTIRSCIPRKSVKKKSSIFRKDILVTIINSLVFSKLYYCSSVWSNTSASNIRKLQGVQNFAARIVSGTRKFDHVSPALKDLRWIPVKSHLYLRDAILAFNLWQVRYQTTSVQILSPEGISVVGRPDHLPSLIYRFLKPSRDRDLFITEL